MSRLTINTYEDYIEMDDSSIVWQTCSFPSVAAHETARATYQVDASSGQVFVIAYGVYDSSESYNRWMMVYRDYSHYTQANRNEKSHFGTALTGLTSYYKSGEFPSYQISSRVYAGKWGGDDYPYAYGRRINPMTEADGDGIADVCVEETAVMSGTLKIAAFMPKYGGL
jgi:hypothetical protein